MAVAVPVSPEMKAALRGTPMRRARGVTEYHAGAVEHGWREFARSDYTVKNQFFNALLRGHEQPNASVNAISHRLASLDEDELQRLLAHEKVDSAFRDASREFSTLGVAPLGGTGQKMQRLLIHIAEGRGGGVLGKLGFRKDVPRNRLASGLLSALRESDDFKHLLTKEGTPTPSRPSSRSLARPNLLKTRPTRKATWRT